MSILLIDNEDSFTYILRQAIYEAGDENTQIILRKYTEVDLAQALSAEAVIISPGPGHPEEYERYYALLDGLQESKVLGVCLGMQVMALWKGYGIYRKAEVIHGISAQMNILLQHRYTRGVDGASSVGLYHSWAVDIDSGSGFELLAEDEGGTAMMVCSEKMLGLQFHPESFMTAQGKQILSNWLQE